MGVRKTIAGDVSLFNFRCHQNRESLCFRDKSGGCPLTGQAVTGMEAT